MNLFNRSSPADDLLNAEKDYFFKMGMKFLKIFKEQDLETGKFDVTFELEGKLLHAHAIVLTSASETLDSWLSNRWTKKDEVIKVESYSYASFYELLCFIYSRKCELTTTNIREMVDIAEFFAISDLKKMCDRFYPGMKITPENIEESYEFAKKYSLTSTLGSIESFADSYSDEMFKSEVFLSYKKPFIEFLSTVGRYADYAYEHGHILTVADNIESKFFESIYKWAEYQVMQRTSGNNENFNLQEAVISELETILPNIKFSNMRLEFVMNFVLEKGFILLPRELAAFYHKFRNGVADENVLKSVYELVEFQAIKKKMVAGNNKSFNIANSIKSDLAEVLPLVQFHGMDKQFLMDFVVAKGIITEEQANHVDDTRVVIRNGGETISGVFKDDVFKDIRQCTNYPPDARDVSNTQQRFQRLDFPLPTHPSTVTKNKGVHWYLCLENDGILTFKHYSAVQQSDYIITEMKSESEFRLDPEKWTYLSASYRNVSGW